MEGGIGPRIFRCHRRCDRFLHLSRIGFVIGPQQVCMAVRHADFRGFPGPHLLSADHQRNFHPLGREAPQHLLQLRSLGSVGSIGKHRLVFRRGNANDSVDHDSPHSWSKMPTLCIEHRCAAQAICGGSSSRERDAERSGEAAGGRSEGLVLPKPSPLPAPLADSAPLIDGTRDTRAS